ncbi:MAG: nucleoside triphosphate pyrophosphohydrolase [Candidatus Nanopelagicales bacterium]
MGLPSVGKLVRDRIPEIIEATGQRPRVSRVSGEDLLDALILKISEEAQELGEADAPHRLEELADIYEVLVAATDALGYQLDEVAATAEEKRKVRGGFTEGWWLH